MKTEGEAGMETKMLEAVLGEATKGPWLINGLKSIRNRDGAYIAKAHWKNGGADAVLISLAPEPCRSGN